MGVSLCQNIWSRDRDIEGLELFRHVAFDTLSNIVRSISRGWQILGIHR